MGFWAAHLFHMFYSLAFPFKAHNFMLSHSTKRRVHLIEVVVITSLGLLSGIITISTSGYEFIGFPRSCTASSSAGLFYTLILPITIGFTIGISLMCASVLIVRRVSC